MKVTTERLEQCVANVIIEVDDETVQPALVQAAKRASGRFQIPGFRKGHAPFDVVRRLVGEDYLLQEAVEAMGPALVERALKEQEIEPFSRPEVTDIKLRPLTLTVSVPLEPIVTLGDYKTLHVERPTAEVTDEDVDKALDTMRRQRATREPVDRVAQPGDFITGMLSIEVEGEEQARQPTDEVTIRVPTVEEEAMPGMSEHLSGAKAGDVVEFDTTAPTASRAADTAPAGDEAVEDEEAEGQPRKPAHVRVEVRTVQEERLPEVNEELAVLLGDYENLDAVKSELRTRLEREAKQNTEAALRHEAVEALVGQADICYPKAAVEDEMDRMVESFERQLRQQRISLEAYFKATKTTREQLRESRRSAAEHSLRESLAMRQLIKAEEITVADEELRARTDRTIANMAADADSEKLLRSPQFQLGMKNNVLYDRALRRLISIVTGEPEAPEEELPAEDMPAAPVSVIEVSESEGNTPDAEEAANA